MLLLSQVAGSATSGTAHWVDGQPRGARAISADGRYVVYESPTSIGATRQVWLFDRALGTSRLVSHAVGGATTPGNGSSTQAVISADGRYVAFVSAATNLTSAPDNGTTTSEVYRYAVATGAIANVSYTATANGATNGTSPRISDDGLVIAFASESTNLLAGQDDANGNGNDLFVWDGALVLASRSTRGPAATGDAGLTFPGTHYDLSSSGRFVDFISDATDLLSDSDTNGGADLFQFDRDTGDVVVRVSSTPGGGSAGNAIVEPYFASSPDGALIAFSSNATNLVTGLSYAGTPNVFLWDRTLPECELVSHVAGSTTTAAGGSTHPALSDDGRYVLLQSTSNGLIAGTVDNGGAADLYLFDRTGVDVTLVSHKAGASNETADNASGEAAMSGDGACVVFASLALDLVAGVTDTNLANDLFVWERASNTSSLISHTAASASTTGSKQANQAQLTPDGDFLVFTSKATDLTTTSDPNTELDVFAVLGVWRYLLADGFETGVRSAWSASSGP